MTLPEKQELFNEIESLPQTYYAEVLDFLQFLKQKKVSTASDLPTESKQRHSLMELQGLGKDLWQAIDTDLFLEDERNAWA